jgi:hypothetical protein
MQKLQELIEAQKNFLKYYELREQHLTTTQSSRTQQRSSGRHSDIVTTEVRQESRENEEPPPSPLMTDNSEQRRLLQPRRHRQNGWMEDAEAEGRGAEDRQSPALTPSADSDKENSKSGAAGSARWAKKAGLWICWFQWGSGCKENYLKKFVLLI